MRRKHLPSLRNEKDSAAGLLTGFLIRTGQKENTMNTRRILKRPVLRLLPILLFFVIRSGVFADMAWDPSLGHDSVDLSLREMILIMIICIIGPVWLFAKGRMLEHYDGDGWRVVIPFYGRYLEYKYYWNGKYYWINIGVWIYILFVTAAVWGEYKEILMLAGLLADTARPVLVRDHARHLW